MTNDDPGRRCSQCDKWFNPVFDIKVDTERVEFAESQIVPDPREIISQQIHQVSKTGLCMACVEKELKALQATPDRAIITVSWPSNGGPNST